MKLNINVLSTVLSENVLLTFKHKIEIGTDYNKKASNSRFKQHLNQGTFTIQHLRSLRHTLNGDKHDNA